MLVLFLSFLTAFTLTYFAIPSIIDVAREKRLYDEPNERSSHTIKTPSLGGISIFAGTLFAIVLWTPVSRFGELQFILCAFIIIFLIGTRDDLNPVSASNKLIAQILAASILVFKSEIILKGFYGMFYQTEEFPFWLIQILVSIFTILVITNSVNLIDGIDGLAGSIGALVSSTFGVWFAINGPEFRPFAVVAFAITGSLIAFLKYNYSPAKIFMGDTGSLLIGITLSILSIKFIELNFNLDPNTATFKFQATPVVAIGILIIPLFDTLRVFTTRIIRGGSPFKPDRRHIHHLLVDFGMTHLHATLTLVFVNFFFIALVFSLHNVLDIHILLLLIMVLATVMTYLLHRAVVKKKRDALKASEMQFQ